MTALIGAYLIFNLVLLSIVAYVFLKNEKELEFFQALFFSIIIPFLSLVTEYITCQIFFNDDRAFESLPFITFSSFLEEFYKSLPIIYFYLIKKIRKNSLLFATSIMIGIFFSTTETITQIVSKAENINLIYKLFVAQTAHIGSLISFVILLKNLEFAKIRIRIIIAFLASAAFHSLYNFFSFLDYI